MHLSYEERSRCIREIAQSRVKASTFEEFSSRIFSPLLPTSTISDDVTFDGGIHRTSSVPSRTSVGGSGTTKDSFAVLKLLDIPEKSSSFRERSSTAVPAHAKTNSYDGAPKFCKCRHEYLRKYLKTGKQSDTKIRRVGVACLNFMSRC